MIPPQLYTLPLKNKFLKVSRVKWAQKSTTVISIQNASRKLCCQAWTCVGLGKCRTRTKVVRRARESSLKMARILREQPFVGLHVRSRDPVNCRAEDFQF